MCGSGVYKVNTYKLSTFLGLGLGQARNTRFLPQHPPSTVFVSRMRVRQLGRPGKR